MRKEIVKRYENNPILTKDDIPYPVQTVHNAGVTKFDSRYIMLFRSHLDTGRSIIGLAESEDGFNFKARLDWLRQPILNRSKESPLSRRPIIEIPYCSLKKSTADTPGWIGRIPTSAPGQSGLVSRRIYCTGAIRDW